MLTNPANAQDLLTQRQRFLELTPGDYGELVVRGPVTITGPANVAQVRTIGYVEALNLKLLSIGSGGIQVIDGAGHLSIVSVSVEGVNGVGVNITGYDTQPSLNLSIQSLRIRKCLTGIEVYRCIRWTIYDLWVDQCENAADPTNPAWHGTYFNDDLLLGGDIHGALATRCRGTSFRGTGSRAYDLIAYKCGGSIAGSRNCEMLTRFTSIEAGAIEVGSQVPCVVEDPVGPVQIKNTCRSPWLQILRPSGQINDGARYPIADYPIAGRTATMTVVPGEPVDLAGRTPETYCRDVLGGTASLDDLWARPFRVGALNTYLRGVA